MLWRDLLVFADGSANGLARAQMAAAMAAMFPGCTLTLCVPAILPMRPSGLGASALADAYDAAVQLAQEDAAAAARQMSRVIQGSNVALRILSPEWFLAEAEAHSATLARSFDVVWIGQPISADRSSLDEVLLAGVLFGSGRPVIVAPRWEQPRPIGTHIVAAWSDTREAARAIHEALPLLTRAERVQLLHLSEESKPSSALEAQFEATATHLRAHDLKNLSTQILAQHDGAPITLMQSVESFAANLVVMGGYGHGRLRQLVFGGMTRAMLQQTKVALFLSH